MSITNETLKQYRIAAKSTDYISALGEFTPLEFTELLDYIDELNEKIKELRGFSEAMSEELVKSHTNVKRLEETINQLNNRCLMAKSRAENQAKVITRLEESRKALKTTNITYREAMENTLEKVNELKGVLFNEIMETGVLEAIMMALTKGMNYGRRN